MPYQSDAQRRFMHARHPDIAARWDAEIRAGKKRKRITKGAGMDAFGVERVSKQSVARGLRLVRGGKPTAPASQSNSKKMLKAVEGKGVGFRAHYSAQSLRPDSPVKMKFGRIGKSAFGIERGLEEYDAA